MRAKPNSQPLFEVDRCFRSDGTPYYVRFDISRSYRPASILIIFGQSSPKKVERIYSTRHQAVDDLWATVAKDWLQLIGFSPRSGAGKEAYRRFIDALPAFLTRYGIKTEVRRVFVV